MSANEPTFKAIFGKDWDALPLVMKKHYANRPFTSDKTHVEGQLNVICKPPLIWLAPLLRLLGQVPPFNENNVPVSVHFQSDENSKAFHFNRIFRFKNHPPYSFRSRMEQVKGNEVIEVMRFGIGWRMKYDWDGEKVILSHRGYSWSIFGKLIPVPLTFLLGEGYAEEVAIDNDNFEMITHITHPLWGKIYQYNGRFKIMSTT